MTDEELRELSIEDLVGHYATQCYDYAYRNHLISPLTMHNIQISQRERMDRLANEIIRRFKDND